MAWVKSRVAFPKRRATLIVTDDQLSADLFTFARAGDFPRLEALCLALCDAASSGRYASATLHSLHFDAERWCWCVGFAHPALDVVAPGMRAPELLDALPALEVARLRVRARVPSALEPGGDAVAQGQGHDATGGGLDEPDEEP